MRLILISGLSGSGKSIALKVLEDVGYYCVDNLPIKLLPATAKFLADESYHHAAISVDARSGISAPELPAQVDVIRHSEQIDLRILFLEASSVTLVKRFSETRRRHPLSAEHLTLPECIQYEREMLEGIAAIAHRIDTSELSPNTLRSWIKDLVELDRSGLTLLFESFGFKNGIPLDADFVFDVRCLPNPHYDPKLRPLSGKDGEVVSFLESQTEVTDMLADIKAFIEKWLPWYIRDNRSYLTIALGCTGGQHRSVYMVEKLGEYFSAKQRVLVRHRELKRRPNEV